MKFFFSCVSCELTHIVKRHTGTELPRCPICAGEFNRDVSVIFTARQLQRQLAAREAMTVKHASSSYAGSYP